MLARVSSLFMAMALVVAACNHVPATEAVSGPRVQVASAQVEKGPDYRGWRRVTEYPLYLAPKIAKLCVMEMKYVGSPHPEHVFHVYVNPIGEKAMLKIGWDASQTLVKPSGPTSKDKFPDGSVIVKEKWNRSAFGENLKTKDLPNTEPELLTVMTKVEGKWVYSVVEKEVVQKGDTKHCISCHERAKATDYVFLNYPIKR